MTINREILMMAALQALSSGAVIDFRSIHHDVKWKLGLTPEEVERLGPSGRTEVSYRLSESLQQMIKKGYVANPARAHYCITEAGHRMLSSTSEEASGIT